MSISITISILILLIQSKGIIDSVYIDKIENNIKNRTIYISSDEIINLNEISKQENIVNIENTDNKYSCLAIIDKYENVDSVMQGLRQSYSCNIYDTSGLYDIKVYNIITTIILTFLILITIFVYLLIMLVVNSIIDGENKDIAILKAIGYTNKHILKIIFFRVVVTNIVSYFTAIILEGIMQKIVKSLLQKILKTDIVINYDAKSLLFIFIGVLLICAISSLINNKKIKKINAITLLKEE